MRSLFLIAALASAPLAARADHTGGTLRITSESSTGSFDVQINYQIAAWPLMAVAYDGLVAFKKVGGAESAVIVPDLAEALPELRDEGRTYVFRLRSGIRFSDGREVTGDDVAASMRRLFKVGSPNAASWFAGIVGADACVKAPATCALAGGVEADGRTVTVHLSAPDAEFLSKLGTPFGAVIPADTPPVDLGTKPMAGTGPYMFASYDPNTAARLVRNPYFHEWSADAQPAGYPDEIVHAFGLQAEAGVTAVLNGQQDAIMDIVPADRLGEIGRNHKSLAHIEQAIELYYVALNVNLAPFDNLKVRQAVSFATDRNAAVKLAGGPALATPFCQFLPAGMPGYAPYCPYTQNPGERFTKPDLARAKQLMAESGVTPGKVTIVTNDLPINRSLGTYMQGVLGSLGFDASVRSLAENIQFTYIQNTDNRVQASVTRWGADYPQPSDYLDVLFGCRSFHPHSDASINISGFCDRGIDEAILAALARANTDPAAALAMWTDIDRRVTDAAPAVSLFQPKLLELVSSRVGNYQLSVVYGELFSQFWVQ